jgi:hypothetical protein
MIGCEEIARKGCEVGHANRFGPAGGAGDYVKVGYGVESPDRYAAARASGARTADKVSLRAPPTKIPPGFPRMPK